MNKKEKNIYLAPWIKLITQLSDKQRFKSRRKTNGWC